MKNSTLLLVLLLCIVNASLYAQDKLKIKYGKIAPADFDLSKHQFDTSVSAVVIADIGSSNFEGNNKGGLSLSFKRHTRVKILNKNGVDAATVTIPLFFNNNGEEKVNGLKGVTYSLENGKIIETELEKKSVFKDKYDKNHVAVKFTLPAVKEGVIFEYSYTVVSDFFFNLQPWRFQGEYPVLYSEYEVKIPEIYNFVFLAQGNFPLKHDVEHTRESYNLVDSEGAGSSSRGSFSSNAARHTWIATNVPVLKWESFTSSLRNHISKIEFQLSQVRYPNSPVREYMSSWTKTAEDLMKKSNFGEELTKSNNWLNDELAPVINGASNNYDKAKKIYEYARDRFTSTGKYGIYLSTSLRNINKNKSGYVQDINLLLVAMLKQQGIEAYPTILSTRNHGYAHELYPLLDRYDYVVAYAVVDGKGYFLDASEPTLGFGKLPLECYNGQVRIIYPTLAKAFELFPDSLNERKMVSVFVRSEKPGEWTGHFTGNLGYYESNSVREKVKSKGEESFFKSIQTSYTADWTLAQSKIEKLKEMDAAVKVDYDFVLNQEDDMVYFNPLFTEGYRENRFKSVERNYPVEMPFKTDETYLLNFDIPADYTVEEIPKSAKVNLGEADGFFEYIIDNTGTTIRLRTRVKLNRTYFLPEEYNDLREFFSYVVKKHAEPIVLKKKK
ncbi:MAG: DUF3857 domain-containing protein [Chitinophagaceae bacterium]|nr:DUF3857 domain-containing protein [Chitinophagaceae bacterium]MCW5929590.1 DUF3857 domain-containing protein [Chitinophagaceae bacterium]